MYSCIFKMVTSSLATVCTKFLHTPIRAICNAYRILNLFVQYFVNSIHDGPKAAFRSCCYVVPHKSNPNTAC
jgi:hypothetical protein